MKYHTQCVDVGLLIILSNLFARQVSSNFTSMHTAHRSIILPAGGGIIMRLDYEESFESFDQNCAAEVGGGAEEKCWVSDAVSSL